MAVEAEGGRAISLRWFDTDKGDHTRPAYRSRIVAREITAACPVPTIGIGASVACDGQILVTEDMTGMFTQFRPKFVKRYADLGAELERAAAAYAEDVRARRFPGPEHTFKPRKKAADKAAGAKEDARPYPKS